MKRIAVVIGIVIGIAATPTVVTASDSNGSRKKPHRPLRALPYVGHPARSDLRAGPGWAVDDVRFYREVGAARHGSRLKRTAEGPTGPSVCRNPRERPSKHACTKKPFVVPGGMVNGRISDAAGKCGIMAA